MYTHVKVDVKERLNFLHRVITISVWSWGSFLTKIALGMVFTLGWGCIGPWLHIIRAFISSSATDLSTEIHIISQNKKKAPKSLRQVERRLPLKAIWYNVLSIQDQNQIYRIQHHNINITSLVILWSVFLLVGVWFINANYHYLKRQHNRCVF